MELFDAHLHIIDPRFPLVVNRGFVPEPFTCNDYLVRMQAQQLIGGAVVSGSFQAFDQAYLLDALEVLGPAFVGVTQLPESVSDRELAELDARGVRAVRFNLERGGSEDVRCLVRMARRIHDRVGWHVELYADAGALEPLYETLISLPAVSIDHLGLSEAGLPVLLRLAEHGVRIKASGFGRVGFDIRPALRALYDANPEVLMFGTDLPSTRARRPYRDSDMALVTEALGADRAARVFRDNALAFYRVG